MACYWITGLSGAGKSTLCRALVANLRSRSRPVVRLDGDELRSLLGADVAHSREERLALARRYASLCRMIAGQDVDVAIATISMFSEVHDWNRDHIPGYVEIFLDVPREERERRDPKRIYAKAMTGEIKDVAGVDLAVDEPLRPDVRIEWKPGQTPEDSLSILLGALRERGADED